MKKPYKTEEQILTETKARIAAVDASYEAYMATQRGSKVYNAATAKQKSSDHLILLNCIRGQIG